MKFILVAVIALASVSVFADHHKGHKKDSKMHSTKEAAPATGTPATTTTTESTKKGQ